MERVVLNVIQREQSLAAKRLADTPSVEDEVMSKDVGHDQLALIRIEGMHCHKCEQAIRKALSVHDGVHEVEVDFASGQASVLFNRGSVAVSELMEAVNQAGYRATGFTQRETDRAHQ
jgi:copper chaperone CopZ